MEPIIGSILPHIQPNTVYIVQTRKDKTFISVHRTEASANEEASKHNLKALDKYLTGCLKKSEFNLTHTIINFMKRYNYFIPFESSHEKRQAIIADYEKMMQEELNQPTATFSFYCEVKAQELG